MLDNEFFDEEFISFRQLTPEELLKRQDRQTILTPQEKFQRILSKHDKRSRRLRKYHFTAIPTTELIYVFDGEGNEICQEQNSVAGCRTARQICLAIFLSAENQNGGYSFSGPNYENLSDDELDAAILATYKNLGHRAFLPDELIIRDKEGKIISGEYEAEKKNFCYECETQFEDRVKLSRHLCTEQWMVREFFPVKHRQYFHREVI